MIGPLPLRLALRTRRGESSLASSFARSFARSRGRSDLSRRSVFAMFAMVVVASLGMTVLTPGVASAESNVATTKRLSEYLTAGLSGTAVAGTTLELDAAFDWTSAGAQFPQGVGGSNGSAYYTAFIANTNDATGDGTGQWQGTPARTYGTETFTIDGPGSTQTPYSATERSKIAPFNPAGWSFTTPTTRQSVGVGFRSWNVSVPEETKTGDYKFTVLWKFAPTGGTSTAIVSAEIDVKITIKKAPRKDTAVIPTVSAGAINGDFEAGGADWLTGGDGAINANSSISHAGAGYAQLGGAPAAGEEPAARIGWLANSSLTVPSDNHATLSFDFKYTTTEAITGKTAYDQLSVIITDSDGPHLQAAWTNLEAFPPNSDARYTSSKLNLDAYKGERISVAFLLTQDYLNPTTVLLDNIQLRETNAQSRDGYISPEVAFSPNATTKKTLGNVAGVITAGALISSASVEPLLIAAGIKTGLAAFALTLPVFAVIAAIIVVAAGAYLLYNSYTKPHLEVTAEATLTGAAVTAVSTAKNARSDPRYTYIVDLKPTAKTALTATADQIATTYSTQAAADGNVSTPVNNDYYYTNFSAFAAEMTTGTANRMQKDATGTSSRILLVGRDSAFTEEAETWPSPAGTAGSNIIGRPADRPLTEAGGSLAALWNLARISQRARTPEPTVYSPLNTGAGVTAYIVDSGFHVRVANPYTGTKNYNPEFTNASGVTRVIDAYTVPGPNSIASNDLQTRIDSMTDRTTSPHGTAVAAVLGGKNYGAAPGVSLIPVRVGVGPARDITAATIAAGLEWVQNRVDGAPNHAPFIVNMSLGTGAGNPATDLLLTNAVTALNSRGLVVLSAGNDRQNACASTRPLTSLSTNPVATGLVVVGSVDSTDRADVDSNWGSCVTLYAPGENIPVPADSLFAPDRYASGTSYAAPLAAGVAAQLLSNSIPSGNAGDSDDPDDSISGLLSAAELKLLLVSRATVGVVRNLRTTTFGVIAGLPATPNSADGTVPSENRILYAGSDCSRSDPAWWSIKKPAGTVGFGSRTRALDSAFRDPACPTDGLADVSLTVVARENIPKSGSGYFKGTLRLMRSANAGSPTVIRSSPFEIRAWVDSAFDKTRVGVQQFDNLPTMPTDPNEYWQIVTDPQTSAITVLSWTIGQAN